MEKKKLSYAQLGRQAKLKEELRILSRLQESLFFSNVTVDDIREEIDGNITRVKRELRNTENRLTPLRNELLEKLSVIDGEIEAANAHYKN